MPPSVTHDAAKLHDLMIAEAFVAIVGAEVATANERAMALEQARLPVRLGGMGLSSMYDIRRAAWVGAYALCWRAIRHDANGFAMWCAPLRRLDLARASDEHFAQLPSIEELQEHHGGLRHVDAQVEGGQGHCLLGGCDAEAVEARDGQARGERQRAAPYQRLVASAGCAALRDHRT